MPQKRENPYHTVTKKMIDISESTLNKVDDTVDTIQQQAKQYSDQMEKYVLANPTRSMGIAFGAGFLCAILLRGLSK